MPVSPSRPGVGLRVVGRWLGVFLAVMVHVGCGGARVRCYNPQDPAHVESINARLDEHKAKIRLHSGEVHTVRSARLAGDQCTWLVRPKDLEWWEPWNGEPDTVAVPVSSIKSIAWKDHGRGAGKGALAGLAAAGLMALPTGGSDIGSDIGYGAGVLLGIAMVPMCVVFGLIAGTWTDYAIDDSCESWAGDEPPD
jgi:tetrahydromethanopterin S-methyltransferase subunit G